MAYLNRVFDLRLKAHLKAMGAVLIEGPKWCGKTTTAKQLANSVILRSSPLHGLLGKQQLRAFSKGMDSKNRRNK